ncbi:hypothetical protein EBZ57_02775 [bacterium]|nr:hypothetical protein [bacterium]
MKTKIKKLTQKGFSHFELALVIVIIAAISAVGFYVFNAKNNKSKADSVTPIANKLVHGSYVSINSCFQDAAYVSTTYKSNLFLNTRIKLTDEKFFNTATNELIPSNNSNTGVFSGRAKPESYKVIVMALNSGKKASTHITWDAIAPNKGADHQRQAGILVGPLGKPQTSYMPTGTIRYWILFNNNIVYSKDIPVSQITNCNQNNYTSYFTSYYTSYYASY